MHLRQVIRTTANELHFSYKIYVWLIFIYVGSYSYPFYTLGTYYYWSTFVDSSGLISMRGVITVVPAEPQILSLKVTTGPFVGNVLISLFYLKIILVFLLWFLAQSCAFPFNYDSINYTSCTTDNDTQAWCSPTYEYTGQRLYCIASGESYMKNRKLWWMFY